MTAPHRTDAFAKFLRRWRSVHQGKSGCGQVSPSCPIWRPARVSGTVAEPLPYKPQVKALVVEKVLSQGSMGEGT